MMTFKDLEPELMDDLWTIRYNAVKRITSDMDIPLHMLSRLLSDPSDEVRAVAANTMKDRDVPFGFFMKVFMDRCGMVRYAASRASIGRADVPIEVIRDLVIYDIDRQVRAISIFHLEHRNDPEIEDILSQALDDSNDDVKLNAIYIIKSSKFSCDLTHKALSRAYVLLKRSFYFD